MKKLIFLLVLLLLAIYFGDKLSEIEGRVVIDLAGTIIQLSLLGAAIFIVFGTIALMFCIWLMFRLFRVAVGSKNWWGNRSSRMQRKAFYDSINAMLINEPKQAQQLLKRTNKGDFRGTNYLIAAELEIQANNSKQAQALLIQAMDYPEVEPLALMKQAELQLKDEQADEAMSILSSVNGDVRKSKAFVMLKLKVLSAMNDWSQVKDVLKANKKLLGDDYEQWSKHTTITQLNEVADKQDADALKQHWQQLTRQSRNDPENKVAYLQKLIDQGRFADAEEELTSIIPKHNDAAYLELYKQLDYAEPNKSMHFIEKQIKRSPQNPVLYSVLANIAYKSDDLELASKALGKALELGDSPEDKALLAKVLETQQEYEQANVLYKGLLKS